MTYKSFSVDSTIRGWWCVPAHAFMAGLLRMISKGGPLITPGFVEDTVEQAWARFLGRYRVLAEDT